MMCVTIRPLDKASSGDLRRYAQELRNEARHAVSIAESSLAAADSELASHDERHLYDVLISLCRDNVSEAERYLWAAEALERLAGADRREG